LQRLSITSAMIDIINDSPAAKMLQIAEQVKQRRLEKNLSQASLAKRADMPLPTYRVFEKSGKVSMRGLLQIAFALDCVDGFNELFKKQQYASLDEVLNEQQPTRKYGKA